MFRWPSTSYPTLFSKTSQSCSVGPLQPCHALLLKTTHNFPVGSLQPCLTFPPRIMQKCPSGSHLTTAIGVLHCIIIAPSGHCIVFPKSVGCPPKVPHSSLSYTICYLSEFSSLHVTRNMRKMHLARLGSFGFDGIPS